MKKTQSKRAAEIKAAISQRLAETIQSSGLTRKEMAQILGMDASDITRCLNGGIFNFTIESLSHIEEVLGIRIFSNSLFPESCKEKDKDCCWNLTISKIPKTSFHDPQYYTPQGHPGQTKEIRLKEGESFKINIEG